MEVSTENARRLRHLAKKMSECGKHAWACVSKETGQPKVGICFCKSRLCPVCNPRRAGAMIARSTDLIKKMDSPRLLTLTVRSNDEPLKAQSAQIKKWFAKLRRAKGFASRCPGGLWTFEITYNPVKKQWHPHIHAVIDGNYQHHSDLRAIWSKITGGSTGVDIRKVNSAAAAAAYVAKYIGKSSDPVKLPPRKLAEYALALQGQRMIQTWGSMMGKLNEVEEDKEQEHWERIVPMRQIKAHADRGDMHSRFLYNCWMDVLELGQGPSDVNLVELTRAHMCQFNIYIKGVPQPP